MTSAAHYANTHGKPSGRLYFGINGKPLSPSCWAKMRAKFHCEVGITKVWRAPQVSGAERIQGTRTGMKYKLASLHGSQKPLKFIDRIVRACTDTGDMVWEPFGGLCPGAVVCHQLGRRYRAAEVNGEFYNAGKARLETLLEVATDGRGA